MKINIYNDIQRKQFPKWKGWKILDFYYDFIINDIYNINQRDKQNLDLLEENLYLIQKIQKLIK